MPSENKTIFYEEDGKLICDSLAAEVYLFADSKEWNNILPRIAECDVVNIDGLFPPNAELKFKDGASVDLSDVGELPMNTDVSNCAYIDLSGRDLSKISPQKLKEDSCFRYCDYESNGLHFQGDFYFNDNIDISECADIIINGVDLVNIHNMKFKDGANVDLAHCKNIPHYLDFSKCNGVNLSGNDLSQIDNLSFKDGANVNLANCKNLPRDLDVSKCDSVNLSGIDLSQIDNMSFKDGANINLANCKNLPNELDLSNCDSVDLSNCDLSNVKNIKFKDGAIINFSNCKNIPANLDISNCAEVNFKKCDLSKIQNMPLKDGVRISFEHAILPQKVDFSKCSKLNIKGLDLSSLENLHFRDGAEVQMLGCKLPKGIDVSNCSKIYIHPQKFENYDMKIGNATVVIEGLIDGKLDLSNIKNVTLSDNSDILMGALQVAGFLGADEIIFRDENQYKSLLEAGANIPEKCKISFSEKSTREQMKQDKNKAQSFKIRTTKKQFPNNQANLKEIMKNDKRTSVTNIKPSDKNIHTESPVSTKVTNPIIIRKYKRDNSM